MNNAIILASASPRRHELLRYIVDNFSIESADIDETPLDGESASNLVERLAQTKAQHILAKKSLCERSNIIVVGSDTVVAKEEIILGKPSDYDDFVRMMHLLSDSRHQVYTGVSVVLGEHLLTQVVVTEVNMALITSQEMAKYWATNEPKDKAGGYAIQGIGGKFVKDIQGSFSAVVGLPLYETNKLIQDIQDRRANNGKVQ